MIVHVEFLFVENESDLYFSLEGIDIGGASKVKRGLERFLSSNAPVICFNKIIRLAMEEVVKAVVLEALRQRMTDGIPPQIFLGRATVPDLREAGMEPEFWKQTICEDTHDRYVGYIDPGEKIVVFCSRCLHRSVQHVFSVQEMLQFLDHLRQRGVHIEARLQRALERFIKKED